MASALFSPPSTTHPKSLSLSSTRTISQTHFVSFINRSRGTHVRCSALSETVNELASTALSLPIVGSGFAQIERVVAELPESEKWRIGFFAGLSWLYLTARPGVLIGAIDAYILAPLQMGFDSLTGKRKLKRSDFLITDKLGEGSFGVVYSGVVVPKNTDVGERVIKRSAAKALESDERFKEKVILKQVSFPKFFCGLALLSHIWV